jgi:hypothetical protein
MPLSGKAIFDRSVERTIEYCKKQYPNLYNLIYSGYFLHILSKGEKMKQQYPINSKRSIKNIYIILLACIVIGIVLYGCKKEEPQQEENSPTMSIPPEKQNQAEQAQEEPAEDNQAENSIELAKWEEGKSLAGFAATKLRAYAAENDMNIDYENITVKKLFDNPDDLQGYYFDINDIKLSDVSFDPSRSENPLRYTITITRPDDGWEIKSFQLLHTGQWIQTP